MESDEKEAKRTRSEHHHINRDEMEDTSFEPEILNPHNDSTTIGDQVVQIICQNIKYHDKDNKNISK